MRLTLVAFVLMAAAACGADDSPVAPTSLDPAAALAPAPLDGRAADDWTSTPQAWPADAGQGPVFAAEQPTGPGMGCWALFTQDADLDNPGRAGPLTAYARNRGRVIAQTKRWFQRVWDRGETDQVVRVMRWRKAWVDANGDAAFVDTQTGAPRVPSGDNADDGWFDLPRRYIGFNPSGVVVTVRHNYPWGNHWVGTTLYKPAMQVSIRRYGVRIREGENAGTLAGYEQVASKVLEELGSQKARWVYAFVENRDARPRVIKTSKDMNSSHIDTYLNCGQTDVDPG